MTVPSTRLCSPRFLIVFPAILLPAVLAAQVTFERTYGGAGDDHIGTVRQTADGGFILVGHTRSFGAGGADMYVIRTDARGDTLWTRVYGSPADETFFSVEPTADGGCVVAGSTFRTGQADITLTKLDSRGDSLWTRTYGGSSDDVADGIAPAGDSGFIIAGTTYSYGAGRPNAYIIRTDVRGDTIWTRVIGGAREECAYSVAPTADSGFVVSGWTNTFGAGGFDVYVMKLNSRGDTLWTRAFGGPADEFSYCVRATSDGGCVAAGWTASFGAGANDFYVIRLDEQGETLWTRTYGGDTSDLGFAANPVPGGGFIITGGTMSAGAGDWDAWLIRADEQGETLWTRTLGGANTDYINCALPAADRGFVFAGTTVSFGAGGLDLWLVKTDSVGRVAVAEPFEPALVNRTRTRPTIQSATRTNTSSSVVLFDAAGRRLDKATRAGVYYTVSASQPVRRVVVVK
jgi:hypothetical protein